jgi:heat-inducible transcriptional repressor
MNERRASILERVTELYIHSAHPVASSLVAEQIGVSSATVRNDFAALEDEGYLQQPHTSAGRIPTARAYEHYASKFIPPGHLSEGQRRLVLERLEGSHGETLLEGVAALTAELSGYAVVVSLPADDSLRALEIHLSAVGGSRVLAVVVLENGLIRQLAVDLKEPPREAVLRDAEASLRQLALPIRELPQGLADLAKRTEEALAQTLTALSSALARANPPRLFSQGLRYVLAEPESADPNFVRLLLERVERPSAQAPSAPALHIALEADLASISTCLPWGGAHLTILGPSRMRYREALTVAGGVAGAVAQKFGEHLN